MNVENSNQKETEQPTTQQKIARIIKERSEDVTDPTLCGVSSIADLFQKKFPEQEWLVDELVPAQAVTIFSASPGSYKTRMLLHLATVASRGEPLFGEFATKQSGFLIIDEESGERLLHKQLKQLGATEDQPIYYRSFQNFKLNKINIEWIKRDCRRLGIQTIIFDSLIQMHNANENDAADMAPVMNHLKQLAEDGYTVLVIAHDRKTGQFGHQGSSELRGSSAILGGVDAHISLRKKKDHLRIEPTKLRHAILHEPFDVHVTGSEDYCEFEFVGSVKPVDNNEALKVAIANQLAEHGTLNQQDLRTSLNNSGTNVGETRLAKVLDEMLASEDDLVWKPGNGKEKLYYLP